jgi:hypothetical protein
LLREIILKYPAILGKPRSHIEGMFTTMEKHGIKKKKAMELVLEAPKMISVDLEKKLNEVHFLFNLYCGFEMNETVKIFKGFPYTACVDIRKLTLFCGEFKKY